ncbi:hypothetical protein DH2020_046753 [Rehmannia glutinosa]|uniref:Transmembrane protein n=1 Tax=Rehmannia glutinosa TaxID=99300 RepID=A0ABR0UAB2_REHGL
MDTRGHPHPRQSIPHATIRMDRFFLFKIGYFVFFIVLALLSTSAVVYTVACIYTAKEVTLKKVLSVVPKVWKRLMVTFIWNFIIVFAYMIVSLLVLVLGVIVLGPIRILGMVFLVVFGIVYLIGLLYITIIWHLASVVSVLEESYGLNAMSKSQGLIKGKMGISAGIFWCWVYFSLGLNICSKCWSYSGMGSESYRHENIDKSSLADHLGEYLGEYVPLKSKDVQLEQFEV